MLDASGLRTTTVRTDLALVFLAAFSFFLYLDPYVEAARV